MPRPCFFIAALVLLATLAGCGVSGRVVGTENDKLRARVLELEGRIKTLEGRNAELETQVAQASRAPSSVPPEIAANTPHVTGISLSRLSQARDEDGDGKLDSIIMYMEPTDGLGRFLQVVGSVSLHAAILPDDGPARTIGRITIGPRELRDGYRSAFTGQYYSLTLPIEPQETTARPLLPDPPGANGGANGGVNGQPGQPSAASISPAPTENEPAAQCTVRVELTDGYTGRTFSAERVIDLR